MGAVVDTIVRDMKAFLAPDEIVTHLAEQGLSRGDAEIQLRTIGSAFHLVAQGKASSMDAIKTQLVADGATSEAAATAAEVLLGLSGGTDGEISTGEVTVDQVVDLIVTAIRERAAPEDLIVRISGLGIPRDAAELQVSVIGSVLQIAAGETAEAIEKYLEGLAEKGVPGVILGTAVRVLERLAREEMVEGDEADGAAGDDDEKDAGDAPPPPSGLILPPGFER
jgi:hypothetical protein